MAFLRIVGAEDALPLVRAGNLVLRPPRLGDYTEWAALREASRAELQPYEPLWLSDELSRAAFRGRLRVYQRNRREGTGYAFFIRRAADAALVGGMTLANVRRGVTQAVSVGYWIGTPFTSVGNMRAALTGILPFVFEELRLHRIEAACIPSNVASCRVLEAVGFVQEGLARRYLRINGSWQDHLLYALTEEEWRR